MRFKEFSEKNYLRGQYQFPAVYNLNLILR